MAMQAPFYFTFELADKMMIFSRLETTSRGSCSLFAKENDCNVWHILCRPCQIATKTNRFDIELFVDFPYTWQRIPRSTVAE